MALGKLRRASGHFHGRLLAVDPHRVCSFSKRHMRPHRRDKDTRSTKVAQTFFVLDVDTGQPLCFTTGTSARTAAAAAEELLRLAADILGPEVLVSESSWSYELLRARGNTIEGGTTEILKNIVAERVLGLPRLATAA